MLRITNPEDLYEHYLRGVLFESIVISDLMKQCLPPNIYFWRDKTRMEVDGVIEQAGHLLAVEIKSTTTLNGDLFESLAKWSKLSGDNPKKNLLICGG